MLKEDRYQQALNRLTDYLSRTHLKRSVNREVLLQQICLFHKRFTEADLETFAAEKHISRATVYNTLNVLEHAKIIRPVARDENSKQVYFDLSLNKENRIRTVCTVCGQEKVVTDAAIKNAVYARKYANFTVEGFTLYVYGTCKSCSSKK